MTRNALPRTRTADDPLTTPRRAARLAVLAAGLVALSACSDSSREVTFVFPNGLPDGTPPAYTGSSYAAGQLPPAEIEDPDAVSFLGQPATGRPGQAGTIVTENDPAAAPHPASAETQLNALATALTRRGTTISD